MRTRRYQLAVAIVFAVLPVACSPLVRWPVPRTRMLETLRRPDRISIPSGFIYAGEDGTQRFGEEQVRLYRSNGEELPRPEGLGVAMDFELNATASGTPVLLWSTLSKPRELRTAAYHSGSGWTKTRVLSRGIVEFAEIRSIADDRVPVRYRCLFVATDPEWKPTMLKLRITDSGWVSESALAQPLHMAAVRTGSLSYNDQTDRVWYAVAGWNRGQTEAIITVVDSLMEPVTLSVGPYQSLMVRKIAAMTAGDARRIVAVVLEHDHDMLMVWEQMNPASPWVLRGRVPFSGSIQRVHVPDPSAKDQELFVEHADSQKFETDVTAIRLAPGIFATHQVAAWSSLGELRFHRDRENHLTMLAVQFADGKRPVMRVMDVP